MLGQIYPKAAFGRQRKCLTFNQLAYSYLPSLLYLTYLLFLCVLFNLVYIVASVQYCPNWIYEKIEKSPFNYFRELKIPIVIVLLLLQASFLADLFNISRFIYCW